MVDASGKTPRLIMLPVDDSVHSERAFEWYVKHLHKPGDKLGIVHVHEPPYVPGAYAYGVWIYTVDKWKGDLKASLEKSKNIIEKFGKKAKDSGIDSESYLTSNQHRIGHSICDLAERKHASSIVIGSRGLNFFRRTLLGSVSSYVVNHANIAVTVTPPAPLEEKAGKV